MFGKSPIIAIALPIIFGVLAACFSAWTVGSFALLPELILEKKRKIIWILKKESFIFAIDFCL